MLTIGKTLTLAPKRGGFDAEILKPAMMVAYRLRWDFWVLEGTAMRGWNAVFLKKEDARILVHEDALADVLEGDDEPDSFYSDVDALPTVLTEDGDELCWAWLWMEGVSYLNPSDDPDLDPGFTIDEEN